MAINAEQLNIILSARDKEFTKAMERSQRRVEMFANRSNKKLKSTTKHFQTMSRAAKAVGAAIAAAVSVQAVKSSASLGKEIANLSAIAGTTAEEFQRWAIAAETVGISQEKLSDILKDVNDRVGDFLQTGGGPMKDFFENVAPLVGVTAEHFKNLSGPQALQLYVDTLQKAGASQQDFTFYLEAMASDSTALIPLLRDNAAELNHLGDEAQTAGRILSNETVAGAKELDDKLTALSDQIRDKFITALIGAEDELVLIAGFIMNDVVPAIEAMIGGLAKAVTLWNDVKDISALVRTGELPEGTFDDWMGTGAVTPGAAPSLDPKAAAALYGGTEEEWAALSTTPAPLKTEVTNGIPPKGLGAGIIPARTEEVRKATDAAAKALEGLRADYDRLLASLDPVVAAQIDFETNQKLINDAVAKGVISQAEGTKTMDLYAQSMADASLEASDLATAMDGIQSSMEGAFMSMVDGTMTAQDAFRSMARDIIKELYRVLVVQRLVGSFSAGGGGILGAAFGMFGGRASGGPVSAGQPYTVGEHGRELFVPQTAGRVLSVAQAKDAVSGGGGNQVTVIQHNTFGDGVSRGEIQAMLPNMIETTKAAVFDAQRRSVSGRGY